MLSQFHYEDNIFEKFNKNNFGVIKILINLIFIFIQE